MRQAQLVGLVVSCAIGAWWSVYVRAGEPAATLHVAAVQMRSTRDLATNIRKTKEHIERCAREGARVVVFPECSVTGYFDDATMKALTCEQLVGAEREVAEACRANGVYAIVGMPWREEGKLYNSAIVIDPSGNVVERYHKVQLAESWPDGGDHLSVFHVDGVPASIIICHDERYPELVRLPVLAGARVVFYISHESGIKAEHKIDPYRAQIQARAVENTVYVVQANAPANEDTSGSHGQSRIIAPDGNIVKEAGVFSEEVVQATLDLGQATGRMAAGSVKRGPLGDWWRAGIGQVRVMGVNSDSVAPSGRIPGMDHVPTSTPESGGEERRDDAKLPKGKFSFGDWFFAVLESLGKLIGYLPLL